MKNLVGHIILLKSYFQILLVFCSINLFSYNYASQTDEFLIAYYPFNGNAMDESGNGNNGVIYGDVQLGDDRFGNPNSAYQFDGVQDMIITDSEFLWGHQEGSISLFFKPTQVSGSNDYLLTYNMDRFGGFGLFYAGDDNFSPDIFNCGAYFGTTPFIVDRLFKVGVWHHYAVTWDRSKLKIYLNGNLEKEFDVDRYLYESEEKLNIGMHNKVDNMGLRGLLDDIRIYSTALSSDSILELYHENNWGSNTPDLYLANPNVDLIWQAGTEQKIMWAAQNIENIGIEYSINGGLIWETITASVPAASSRYIWVTPEVESKVCLIRIFDADNPNSIFDISNEPFVISGFNNRELVLNLNAENGFLDVSGFENHGTSHNVKIEESPWGGLAYKFEGDGFVEIEDLNNGLDFIGDLYLEIEVMITDFSNSVILSKENLIDYPRNIGIGYGAVEPHVGYWWATSGMTVGGSELYLNQKVNIKLIIIDDNALFTINDNHMSFQKIYGLQQIFENETNDFPLRLGTGRSTAPGQHGQHFFTGYMNNIMIYKLHVDPNFIQNSHPIANAGEDASYELSTCEGTIVTLDGSLSYDLDGDNLYYYWTWEDGFAEGVNPVINLPFGETNITLIVNDGELDSDPDDIKITIVDTSPPEIFSNNNVISLWPPNHKYERITIDDFDITASDNCNETLGEFFILSVASDEPENGNGDGNTFSDIIVTSCNEINLRKERDGNSNGRVYTITIGIVDGVGNIAATECYIEIPIDKKSSAINDGSLYVVPGCDNYIKKELISRDDVSGSNAQFSITQNYPNPFNPTTTIYYSLTNDCYVSIDVFNSLGQKVISLVDAHKPAGNHEVNFNANDFPSGVYLYQLRAENFREIKKMLLLK